MTTPRTMQRRYRCDRCGRRLGDIYVYSRFTKCRYCADLDACQRRHNRVMRKAAEKYAAVMSVARVDVHKLREDRPPTAISGQPQPQPSQFPRPQMQEIGKSFDPPSKEGVKS